MAFIMITEANPAALLEGVRSVISLGVVSKIAFFNS